MSPNTTLRNTPTSVGKTVLDMMTHFLEMKHPHERGEDLSMNLLRIDK